MPRWLWRSQHYASYASAAEADRSDRGANAAVTTNVATYLAQVNAMKREFLRIGAET
jgi:hypothetical protein